MKQITRNITKQEIITFAAIAIISMIIWFAGPYLVISDHLPLFEPEKRFGVIMVLFLGWLLLSLIFSTPTTQQESRNDSTPETLKKLQILQGRFQGAVEFLQKTLINKQGHNINLSHLPWYVLIGPKGSGKTSLLANANVNYILSKQFKPETLMSIAASETCDWWVTSDLVLVDIPGSYIQSKEKTGKNSPRASLQNMLWYNLLNLIQNYRKQQTLNGVVITLNLPEMIRQQNNNQQKMILPEIRQRILELKEKFGSALPCYFVITKFDLLPGFSDFFGESSSDELAQAWGITLPALHPGEKLHEILTHRFNAVIKRLNKQLIWRLHQERNPQARTMVKDFPLQMERVKEATVQFIKALALPNLGLHGIYFTSALQANQNDSASVTINQTTHQPHQYQALQILQAPTTLPSKPYFIRQLIMQGLFHTQEYTAHHASYGTPHWQRRAIYTGSITTIVAAALFLGYDFQQGIQQAYSIRNNLTQYQLYIQQDNQPGNHLLKALPLLNSLHDVTIHSGYKLTQIANRLAFYSHKSQQTADEVYMQALQTIVLPEIKNNFEHYLANPNEKNPTQLYAVLKAYLMLTDTEHNQTDYIADTIRQLLPEKMTQQAAQQLRDHINTALKSNFQATQLDNKLIAQARKQLVNLSAVDLAYVILKNTDDNNSDSAIPLGTDSGNSPVFVSKALASQIPNMFTANQFKQILSTEIIAAATDALHGNWIIGSLSATQDPAALSEQLHSQYIANYVDIWESQLANIKLYTPKNLTELNNTLDALTSSNSPLLQMLQTIQQNTSFEAITAASPKLQSLNALLANADTNQDNQLYQMFLSFRELHTFIQTITTSNDAIYEAAKAHMQKSPDPLTRMNDLAERIPDPMKSWLTSMSTHTWVLIARNAAQYADSIWQKDIISQYHTQIANRYPFAHNATQDINLQDFANFLGQQGLLMHFYQTYLKPFIDDSQNEWHWKTVNGQQLPLKNSVLMQLQNIAKIQRAFFPNGDNQLYVHFTLQPMSIDPSIKSVNLSINGQQFNYQRNDVPTPRVISWPGNNSITHASNINFTLPTNQVVSNSLDGDWGWFKLVDQALQNVNSRKELVLKFDINGHTAKYLLFTEGHLNPFLSLNFEKLQLPETLI